MRKGDDFRKLAKRLRAAQREGLCTAIEARRLAGFIVLQSVDLDGDFSRADQYRMVGLARSLELYDYPGIGRIVATSGVNRPGSRAPAREGGLV